MSAFVVAKNPNTHSTLPYLLYLPLGDNGLWLKAKDRWPRQTRVYCHPLDEPPATLDVLESVAVLVCERRGVAIDLVLARGTLRRSQFIFTTWRGRSLILWQTASTARSTKPGLRIPHGRCAIAEPFYVDTRERYGYTFARHSARTERRTLPVGDYCAMRSGNVLAVVERKTASDFVTCLIDGSLNFTLAELAALPCAQVVVEGTYSQCLRHAYTPHGLIPHLLAQVLIRYPHVPVNFLETRAVAEEWTFRFLATAYTEERELPMLRASVPVAKTEQ